MGPGWNTLRPQRISLAARFGLFDRCRFQYGPWNEQHEQLSVRVFPLAPNVIDFPHASARIATGYPTDSKAPTTLCFVKSSLVYLWLHA